MAAFILTLLIFVFPLDQPAMSRSGPPRQRIANALEPFRARLPLSGTLLVRNNGRQEVWNFGLADDSTRRANLPDTVYMTASISKSFVAASILKLKDNGMLKLSAPVSSIISEYPPENLSDRDGRRVTLFHLLTHTSGIPEAYDSDSIADVINRKPLTFSEMIEPIKKKPLLFSPGSRFLYSNTGYLILGEVIRRVTGQSYRLFLQKNFFQILPLKHTSVGLPQNPESLLARLYEANGNKRVDLLQEEGLSSLANSDIFADMNIYSSAPDLADWTEKITSTNILTDESRTEMLTPHLAEYGFGWFAFHDAQGRIAYEHAGEYDGYQSWMRRYPDQKLTVIWLGNEGLSNADLVAFFEAINSAALDADWSLD